MRLKRPTTRAATRRTILALGVATLVLGFAAIAVFATGAITARHAKPTLALAGKERKSLRLRYSMRVRRSAKARHR